MGRGWASSRGPALGEGGKGRLWCLRALLTRPPGGSGGKWLRMSQEGGIVGGGWAV